MILWRIVFWYTCQLLPRYTGSFFVLFCYCYTVACFSNGCVHFVARGCGGVCRLEESFGILVSFSCFDKILRWMPLFLKLLWRWISYIMWFYIFY